MTATDPITPERLKALGFLTDDEKAAGEFCVRIRGGSDDGWKTSSDDDDPSDEIAELILSPVPDSEAGAWGCFAETYHATTVATVAVVELGTRTTMGEVIDLCRALKAWAIRYPDDDRCTACGWANGGDGRCTRRGCCNSD